MRALEETKVGRLLHSLSEAVINHWRWFYSFQLLLIVVCLVYTVRRMQFSTDRSDLISARESYHHQFLAFRKEFQVHDNMFVLVESESREKNRAFVERLATRVRADAHFEEVYYRAGLKLMGPKALLFLAEENLAELRQSLVTNQALLQYSSEATNLDTLFGLVNRKLRMQGTNASGLLKEGTFSRSVQMLQWVAEKASESIESRHAPLAPNLGSLLGTGQDQARRELYLTFDRGRIYVVVAQPKRSSDEKAAIAQLRKWIAETLLEVPGVNAEITGEAVLRHEEMQQARHDTELAALIALALTAGIFIGSCRGVLRPLMATICLLAGICYTLGFATLTVGRLNILSITLVPVLIGLAIDYGVHLIFRYEEEIRHGQSCRSAIGKALGFTGIGVITNALTIAGAFYCMLLTDFKGVREMGLIAGSGVLVCLVPMLTLLPLLLVRGCPDERGPRSARGKHKRQDPLLVSLPSWGQTSAATGPRGSLRARIGQLYLDRPWVVLVCGAGFTIFTLLHASNVQFDYNLLNLQSQGLPAVRMQRQLIREGAQSLLYCAVVADSLPQAVEWERRINELPSVARVLSLVKYLTEDQERKLALIRDIKQRVGAIALPELDPRPVNLTNLNQSLFSLSGYVGLAIDTLQSQGGQQSSEELLRSLRQSVSRLRQLTANEPRVAAERLTAFQQALFGSLHETVSLVEQQDDRQRLKPDEVPAFLRGFFISPSGKFLLQVYPKEDVWQRDKQANFIGQLRTVDPNVTGTPVQFYEYTSRLRKSVEQGALCAAGIVGILVYLHFRRLTSVLLALLPVALGFCWMIGLMGWLGIRFNPVNIVSLILVIGIGVTNGVHILNRFAEEPHPNVLARSTGKAVLVSALNTMAGFGSLMVAKHQGIASFGGIMALGTGTCVVASLTFLPAVLTLLSRVGWCASDPPRIPD